MKRADKSISTWKLNTLFSRFLILFIIFVFLMIFLSILNFIYAKKNKELQDLKELSLNVQTDIYNINNQLNRFYMYSLVDSGFYKNKEDIFINNIDSLLAVVEYKADKIFSNKYFSYENTDTLKYSLKKNLSAYRTLLDSIILISKVRGYKDFGLVGKMRFYAHKLERYSEFPKWQTLMLRRHEKDYIIRHENKYIKLFELKNRRFKKELLTSNLQVSQKDSISRVLDKYLEFFKQLVYNDKILGIKSNTGLKKHLENVENQIQKNVSYIHQQSNLLIYKYSTELKLVFTFIVLLTIVGGFIIGLYFIRYLTRPISKLSENIKNFVDFDFQLYENFEYKTNISEIVVLIESYFSMKGEIVDLLNDFQQKVEEKTEKVQKQKRLIEEQKIKVEKINKEIVASINYAKTIQEAMLPNSDKLKDYFSNFFLIYKPRDIVSGDFIWFKRIKNELNNLTVVAIADCTGHGVPGAMMSMLSIAYLNEIVPSKEIFTANEILNKLREKISKNFYFDGLDIAFIIINEDEKLIEFSGANRHLFFRHNDIMYKIKGDRMPIGRYPILKEFTQQIVAYESGDQIFAFSDGIHDQLSPKGKKYGIKAFFASLDTTKEMQLLEKELIHNYENWKKDTSQTDDIIVFAAEL